MIRAFAALRRSAMLGSVAIAGEAVDAQADKASERPDFRLRRTGFFLPVVWVAFVLLYWLKPDWATAVWYWPAWIWASLIVVFAFPALAFRRFKWFGLMVLLSLAFALSFDDMPRGVVRGWWRVLVNTPPSVARPFRVASINCEGGSAQAAKEALDSGAELILLQESPGRKELEQLVQERWGSEGSAIAGADCSILARGKLWTVGFANRPNFTWAMWETPGGENVFVLSLRLRPPTFRLDYWNPDCWRAYAEDRARRKQELDEIMAVVKDLAIAPETPIIVAGDFNGPPSECFQESLQALCTDSFAKAGSGWGGTGTNDYQFVRFDQIWVRPYGAIVGAWVKESIHSDHRMALAAVRGL